MASPRCHRARPQWPGVILEGVEDGDAGRALHVSPGASQPCRQLDGSSLLFPSFLKSSCGTGVSYRGLLCQFV